MNNGGSVKKLKAIKKRLKARQDDYDKLMKTHNQFAHATQSRKESGGFHRPGSNTK
jgi:hypothetical protein